jgi:hypothetical protein
MVLLAFSSVAKGNLSFLVRLHGAQSPGEAFQGIDFWSAGNIPGNLLTPNGRRSGEEGALANPQPPGRHTRGTCRQLTRAKSMP